jgi:5-(aminomethyl)-3-furanmethanol phosphate kinase
MTVVVKLGGSLAEAGSLRSWLALLMERGGSSCVIVPGGGDFAEAVRAAQARYGFSDRAAHRMALLAMQQYGLLLMDLAPSLTPCASEVHIRAVLAAGGLALWWPCAMVDAEPGIAASWAVSSDSLAAWLAHKIDAARLVLVKSAPAPPPPLSPSRLAALGLVDRAFPNYAEGAPFALVYCGPGEEARLAAALGLG